VPLLVPIDAILLLLSNLCTLVLCSECDSSIKVAGMRRHHPRWAVVFIVSLVAAAVGEFPRQSLAQNPDGDGHSYMHIVIGDHVLTNFGPNANYQKGGWLAIDSVAVKNPGQTHVYRGNTDRLPKGWVFLSAKMKSGHHGPGTLSFGVGDSGGLDPLLAAQKNGTIIPSADLDLFPDYGQGQTLIGKYVIKRIRILAVEDVPVSACGMYDVTIRFQSIEPRAPQQ
jgi:hypothetical protein